MWHETTVRSALTFMRKPLSMAGITFSWSSFLTALPTIWALCKISTPFRAQGKSSPGSPSLVASPKGSVYPEVWGSSHSACGGLSGIPGD